MKLSLVFLVVIGLSAVGISFAQITPSPFPTVAATPSVHWDMQYWAGSYSEVVQGGHPSLVLNSASAIIYCPLDDLPTSAMLAREVNLGSHGHYLNMIAEGIVQNQADQYSISGTAVRFDAPTSSLELPFVEISSATDSTSVEFWFMPLIGAQGVLTTAGFSVELTSALVTVKDRNGATIFHSRPGSVTINRYHHVVIQFGVANFASERSAQLWIDGRRHTEVSGLLADGTDIDLATATDVVIMGSGFYVDEYAQYSDSSPFALNSNEITVRFVNGDRRACRCGPCFSASTCTPLGSQSYECSPCPPNYVGDGETCIPVGLPTSCTVPPAELHNPYFCSLSCSSLSRCMECTMSHVLLEQVDARVACQIRFATP